MDSATQNLKNWATENPNKNAEPSVESIYLATLGGRWSIFLVLPGKKVEQFNIRYSAGNRDVGTLLRDTYSCSDANGLPAHHWSAQLTVSLCRNNDPNTAFNLTIDAAYMINQGPGLKRWLTLKQFENSVLAKHGLKTNTHGGELQWCAAVLDALETDGAVPKGETIDFYKWLNETGEEMARYPAGPQLALPYVVDTFLKSLKSMQLHKDIQKRELTGK